jgi:Putative transposase
MKMLTRRGVLIEEMGQTHLAKPDGDGDEARTLRPLQAAAITCRIAFGHRAGQKVQKVLTRRGAMPPEGRARQPLCADIDGFSLHAAGQVELKLKTPWRDGTMHLVMSPLEFMQRLAALVPRPRLHLIRFHGVLAPNARLRAPVAASPSATSDRG